MSEEQRNLFEKNKHAAALSALGAAKGGRARASTLTKEARQQIAKQAAKARWGNKADTPATPSPTDPLADEPLEVKAKTTKEKLPYAMFPGKLKIADVELECYVLDDFRRVFSQRAMVNAIAPGVGYGNFRRFLDAIPNTNADSWPIPIKFNVPGTQFISHGYEASVLIDVCSKYSEAREKDLLKPNQQHLGRQADIIIRSCAKVGVIALVDEATGYQVYRKKKDLELKLQAFIADEMQEWVKVFPDEFWYELARLESIHYSPRSRPLRWGKYVMAFVYDAIDEEIGQNLREKNPNPQHRRNHHQWLKEFGKKQVEAQLIKVVTIMKLCTNMEDFRTKFAHVFKKSTNRLAWESFFEG